MGKIHLKKNEILVLRTSDKDGKSRGGFQWPVKGHVEAPDWNNIPVCGGGLHGLPRGCGQGRLLKWDSENAAQLVVVDTTSDYLEGVGELGGKCKFREGVVVFSKIGGLHEAIEILSELYPDAPVVGRTATAGDAGTATAGDAGTATAGDRGTATAGDRGTATAGDAGTATAGDAGTATAGDVGTATAGNRGTATAGDAGTATAGDRGTATAGYAGTATAGDDGMATAGNRGTATAGNRGTLVIKYWDGMRYRFSVGYVGENNIEPNKSYRLDEKENFVLSGGAK